jgi:hypothetical protein
MNLSSFLGALVTATAIVGVVVQQESVAAVQSAPQSHTPLWTPSPHGGPGVAAPPDAPIAPPHGAPILIHRGLQPGDVIARGNPKVPNPATPDDDCTFDVGIAINIESGSRTVSLIKGPGCTLILDRVDDINVLEGRIARHEQVSQRGMLALLRNYLQPLWNLIEPRVSAASGPRRIQQYAWMYGYGGTSDILTVVKAFSDFSWDGYNVWVNAAYSYCQPHNSTGWLMDYCYLYDNVVSSNQSTGPITRRDVGQFEWECAPGPCYQHQISAQRYGYWDGATTCTAWWVGSIVSGVTERCDVFTPPPCGTGVICFDPAFNIGT